MEAHGVHGIDTQTLLGGLLLRQFQSLFHTLRLPEIVAGFQRQPLRVQFVSPRVVCDGAPRMAAYLPDVGCAAASTAAIAALAATAATAVGAGRGVGAAAGGCSS